MILIPVSGVLRSSRTSAMPPKLLTHWKTTISALICWQLPMYMLQQNAITPSKPKLPTHPNTLWLLLRPKNAQSFLQRWELPSAEGGKIDTAFLEHHIIFFFPAGKNKIFGCGTNGFFYHVSREFDNITIFHMGTGIFLNADGFVIFEVNSDSFQNF